MAEFKRQRTRRRWSAWRWRWMAVATLGVLLAAAAAWWLPRWTVAPRTAGELAEVKDPAERLRLQDERDQQRNTLRGTLLTGLVQAVGLSGILGGTFVAWQALRQEREALQNTRDLTLSAQLAERFTRAVDQLGHASLDVHLGGIYALEQLAKAKDDPAGYRATVAEVLTAFVRGHAPWPPDSAYGPDVPSEKLPELQIRAADVQAAMTVLGRPPEGRQSVRLDLHGVDLRRAKLDRAQLQGADLRGAQLQGADLRGAKLQRADLGGAQLQGAVLYRAQLQGAVLYRAQLQDAKPCGVLAADVLEVRKVSLTPVPETPASVEGVFNVRGRVVAVRDLRKRLGLAPTAAGITDYLILVRAGQRVVAVRADPDVELVETRPLTLIEDKSTAPTQAFRTALKLGPFGPASTGVDLLSSQPATTAMSCAKLRLAETPIALTSQSSALSTQPPMCVTPRR